LFAEKPRQLKRPETNSGLFFFSFCLTYKSMAKKDTFKLQLEVNKKFIDPDKYKFQVGGVLIVTSPLELNEDYWQFRVRVHEDQEIVGFPKFYQVGIGFAKEDDWNRNLPSGYSTQKIWNWIKHNKRYDSIPDKRCIEAIKLIQKAAQELQQAEREADDMIIMSNEPKFQNETTGNALSLKEFVSRCHIKKEGRMETFTNTTTKDETKKRLYCLLFGFDQKKNSYKYRMSGYFFNGKHATSTFYRTVRLYNLNGSKQTGDRWIDFKVDIHEGFKVPIAKLLPHPMFD
jgi:hypothetical protein